MEQTATQQDPLAQLLRASNSASAAMAKEKTKATPGNSAAAAAPPTPAPAATNGVKPPNERFDAVRDLLFGDQVNEITDSLRSLEKQLIARIGRLENDTKSELENTERRLQSEIESLGQNLRKEASNREELGKEVGKRLDAATVDLKGQISGASDKLARGQSELRMELEREIDAIRKAFSPRRDLGALFSEVGKRLSDSAPAA